MKNIALLFFTLITFNTLLADTISGKGRFVSDKSDRLSFVKEQLLHSAYIDVVTQAMQQFGLDHELFWKNYNEALYKRIESYEQSVKTKYADSKKDISEAKDEIRYKKLNITRKFGNIASLIQSYSIKSMTRSSSDPNYRYISIDANVSKDNLSNLYYRYASSKSSSLVDKLLIQVDFNNKLFNYSEIGVDRDTDFTSVIEENWKAWFKDNKPSNIKDVDILSESDSEEVEAIAGEAKDFPSKYENSLYLKVIVNMKKLSSNTDLKSFDFYFQVSGFLMDIKSNRILKSFNVEESDKSYNNVDMDKFSSVLANYIYRMPMTDFKDASHKLRNLRQIENNLFVNLINYKNLAQVNDIRAKIDQRGIKYSLITKLSKIAPNFVTLSTISSATLVELNTILKELYSGKNGSNIEIIESSTGLSIKFK